MPARVLTKCVLLIFEICFVTSQRALLPLPGVCSAAFCFNRDEGTNEHQLEHGTKTDFLEKAANTGLNPKRIFATEEFKNIKFA